MLLLLYCWSSSFLGDPPAVTALLTALLLQAATAAAPVAEEDY